MHEWDADEVYSTSQAKWPDVQTLGDAKPGQYVEVAWITGWVLVQVSAQLGSGVLVRIPGWFPGPRLGPWPLHGSVRARKPKRRQENSDTAVDEGVFQKVQG